MKIWVSGCVLAWLLADPAGAAAVEGQVLRVIDGDSLIVQTAAEARPLEVRLQGIDAPEGCQTGGPEARAALAAFVQDKTVALDVRGRDHYGRTLATVRVDGQDVNQRMVADGQAWSLRSKWNRGPYVKQERVAQTLRRGLHATPGAEQPSDFRKRHGPCQGAPAGPDPAASAAGASTSQAAAPAALATVTQAFHCDGRTRCSQMRSCEEATWFLQHCAGAQMDGNGDGVPCERQWCR